MASPTVQHTKLLYSTADLAEQLNHSPEAVRRLVRKGIIEPSSRKKIGKTQGYLFDQKEAEKALAYLIGGKQEEKRR